MRGQIFSIDFVVAAAVLLLCAALAVQVNDLAMRRMAFTAGTQTNFAQTVADEVLAPAQGFRNYSQYCYKYSDASMSSNYPCGGFDCGGSTYTAIRLTQCNGAPCTLEVRTCA